MEGKAMCGGADIGVDINNIGGDGKMIIDGVNIPPKNQDDVKRILKADEGLPAFYTDQQIKKKLKGEKLPSALTDEQRAQIKS